jgi:hypothetical protein
MFHVECLVRRNLFKGSIYLASCETLAETGNRYFLTQVQWALIFPHLHRHYVT